MGGDFNELRNEVERIGCSRRDRGMKDFNEFIDRCEVTEIQMLGRKCTWCNAHEGIKWSKIDRFLLSPERIVRFKLKLWGLSRTISDHCPLVLMENVRDWGPKPFKFLNAWLSHPKFGSLMEKVCGESHIVGDASFPLQNKLQALKMALKQWNREVYGTVESKQKAVKDELHILDLKAEVSPLVEAELKQKRELRSEMWTLSRMIEWAWLQKSRLDWNLKGDRNTRFFQYHSKLQT